MDANMMTDFLRAIFQPGDVFEVRVLDAVRPAWKKPHIESGYFDYENIEKVPAAIAALTWYRGCYVTPNPVAPALLSRAVNRLKPAGRNETTSDHDVIDRRWLLLDLDPARPAGIAATDEEHLIALEFGAELRTNLGWPVPLVMDSGNGCQLMYRLPPGLPADACSAMLKSLATMGTAECT